MVSSRCNRVEIEHASIDQDDAAPLTQKTRDEQPLGCARGLRAAVRRRVFIVSC